MTALLGCVIIKGKAQQSQHQWQVTDTDREAIVADLVENRAAAQRHPDPAPRQPNVMHRAGILRWAAVVAWVLPPTFLKERFHMVLILMVRRFVKRVSALAAAFSGDERTDKRPTEQLLR